MKAKIHEHDNQLELVIECETYEEHMLVNAFLREQEHELASKYQPSGVLPISNNPNGRWTLTLGSCRCEQRAKGES